MSDALDIFFSEMQELIEELEQALMTLESEPTDKETINLVFRVMHTIKGSSGMFGFVALSSLTHYLEELFDHIRTGDALVSDDIISLSLQCKDEIERLLDADLEKGTLSAKKLIEQIKEAQEKALSSASSSTDGSTSEDTQRLSISITPSKDSLEVGLKPLPVLRELSELGDYQCSAFSDKLTADLEHFEPYRLYFTWEITLVTKASLQEIQDVFIFVSDDWDIKIRKASIGCDDTCITSEQAELMTASNDSTAGIGEDATTLPSFNYTDAEPLASTVEEAPSAPSSSTTETLTAEPEIAAPSATEQPTDTGAASAQAKNQTSLKVSSVKLDELMDLVGEMVIAQTRLNQLSHQMKEPSLDGAVETMMRLVDGVRDSALSMRMLQVGTLFSRFKRLVRDTAKDLDKQINLETEGTETELDKTVIDRLADPLVHLVRNSLDHGIETPEQRRAAGKPEAGTLHLRAMHAESNVLIIIEDDGGGIDAEKVVSKARAKGLIAPGKQLSHAEALNLIFEPGFSTAENVSQLSGRGVGMDAVKRAIEGLGGKVELQSEVGKGTTTKITLPLTMAIIEGLHVKVSNTDYVIPLSKVNECLEAKGQSRAIDVLNLRGSCIPQISLGSWFKLADSTNQTQEVVIAGDENRLFGLVVDQIIGQQQTVVKGLSPIYDNVAGVSGATILGDGNVALILDVDHLFEAVSASTQQQQLH